MKKLILTRGLPASGKTSWAEQKVRESNGEFVNINRDDIRQMLFGCSDYSKYRFSREKERLVTETQRTLFGLAVANKKSVIVSDTNLNPGTIKDWKDTATDWNYEYTQKDFFDVSIDELIKRDAGREKTVGSSVILGMYTKYYLDIHGFKSAAKKRSDLSDAIIVDIDGTVADMKGKRSPYEWDKVDLDTPHYDIIKLVETLAENNKVIFLSGRDGSCLNKSIEWLNKHTNLEGNYDIFQRRINDTRADYLVKYELYNEYIRNKYNVTMVIDDRDQVVRLWRALGLRCIQVADGNF